MIRISTRSPSAAYFAALSGAAALSLVAASPVIAEETLEEPAAELSKGETRLAKMLEGREAGEAVNCIRDFGRQRLTTIEDTAYVYGRGNTIYVQRTRNPDRIDRQDTLVVQRTNGSQLCRFDIATTVEPVTGFFTGVVQFEDFVPYTRVKDDAEEAR